MRAFQEIWTGKILTPLGPLFPVAVNDVLVSCSFHEPANFRKSLIRNNPALDAMELFLSCYFTKKPLLVKLTLKGAKDGRNIALDIFGGTGSGKPTDLSMTLDLSAFTENEFRVYERLLYIPCGGTISYGALARESGFPSGGRFVGNTMAKNSFPVLIPCHRVVRSDGKPGNYTSGPHKKIFLLEHEKE
jgi:O-6-methylguanine DNA methyltransferase